MFYSFNITVTHGTTAFTPVEQTFYVSAGVIHQVDIIFPAASSKEVYVQLLVGSYQFIPSNRGEAIRADDTIISTREFMEISPANNELLFRAWNVHATDDLLVGINIGILPKKILQPFSFDELLKAALSSD